MTNLPRLELTEDPNKNNEYIIFRYSTNGKKTKHNRTFNNKRLRRKHSTTKKINRKSRKGFLNIF